MNYCPSRIEFQQFDDQVLVRYVQSGNTAWRMAAGVLLERYRSALLRRCRARLRNKSDAEDALQESLLRAFRSIKGFKGEAGFKTWLFVIADNQCNTLLAQRVRHQMTEHLRALIEIHQQACHDSLCEEDRSGAGVRRILGEIPERDREILALRFYGELSIEELARTLGLKLSAAKMRLYRALERFESSYRQLSRGEVNG